MFGTMSQSPLSKGSFRWSCESCVYFRPCRETAMPMKRASVARGASYGYKLCSEQTRQLTVNALATMTEEQSGFTKILTWGSSKQRTKTQR